LERLIFGDVVKSAETPLSEIVIDSETSSRHISGTVEEIATNL
jgi:hypothetical protein